MITFKRVAVAAAVVAMLAFAATVVAANISLAPADTTPAKPAATLTFTKDIKPLTEAKCKGCHAAVMSNYDQLIAKKLVVPNKADDSKFYTKPSGKASHGGGNVWKDKADLVKQWIATGAAK